MDLILFIIFLLLSLLLIILGLIKTEHSEIALIGFAFLFLLSIVLIVNDIQIKTGEFTEELYSYDNLTINHINITTINTYEDIDLGGNLSHIFGYWLAVISMIGFIGVVFGLRKQEGF